MLESCRECRDEGKEIPVPATVIIWGKLFPPEALGPKCDNHAAIHIGGDYYSPRLANWAVFDLRGLDRGDR